MTHDELLANITKIQNYCIDAVGQVHYEFCISFDNCSCNVMEKLQKGIYEALRAVVELHKPHHYEMEWMPKDLCSNCMEEQGDYMSPRYSAYPCPTIQAIEKELA